MSIPNQSKENVHPVESFSVKNCQCWWSGNLTRLWLTMFLFRVGFFLGARGMSTISALRRNFIYEQDSGARNDRTSDAGSQYRCGRVIRGRQPPSTPHPTHTHIQTIPTAAAKMCVFTLFNSIIMDRPVDGPPDWPSDGPMDRQSI